jgi:hypothetical protein
MLANINLQECKHALNVLKLTIVQAKLILQLYVLQVNIKTLRVKHPVRVAI